MGMPDPWMAAIRSLIERLYSEPQDSQQFVSLLRTGGLLAAAQSASEFDNVDMQVLERLVSRNPAWAQSFTEFMALSLENGAKIQAVYADRYAFESDGTSRRRPLFEFRASLDSGSVAYRVPTR